MRRFIRRPLFSMARSAAREVIIPSSGTKLGRYEILALPGAGGIGEVYRARDQHETLSCL